MIVALVLLTLLLAAANGANDISKGIATLVGAGLASPRHAVAWGVITTAAGGLVAAFVSQGLVRTFSGKGVIETGELTPLFFLAVACGAVAWLVVATWTGLPVSTTHSLFGALVGAAMASHGAGGVLWGSAVVKIVLPLLFSPLVALLLVMLAYPLARRGFERLNRYCICIEETSCLAEAPADAAAAMSRTFPGEAVTLGSEAGDCSSTVVRLNAMDSLHWLSAGATSFFRGMNDTPKILAIGVVATATGALSIPALYAMVAVAMAAGGAVAGMRVIRTLSQRVTPIDHEGGLAANAVTSLLVGLASRWALPVSTTHVSTGAIVGNGLSRGGRDLRTNVLGGILLAWVVTLPASGIFAAAMLRVLESLS